MVQTTFNYNKNILYMIFLASLGGGNCPLSPPLGSAISTLQEDIDDQ